MGRRQDNHLAENPEIAKAYILYTSCRRRHLIVATLSKGSSGDSVTRIIPYTDGLLFLPVRLMSFFDAFEAGEQEAFNLRMK